MKFWDLSFCDCCYIRICLLYSLIPPEELFSPATVGILHVCGGDPVISDFGGSKTAYSPRMWRYCYIGIPEEIMNVIIRDHKENFKISGF